MSRSRDPLLDLRFIAPGLPRSHVERARLGRRLDEATRLPLTLVSAPAGSGKTTLVAAWVATHADQGHLGWITFEPGDVDSGAFWPLFVECLARAGVGIPTAPKGGHPTHRRMLTDLGAALAKESDPVVVVLDGCEIADLELADDLTFVLTHSGRRLRLILLTRADPVLPLHRFRLDEAMTELRMADLAFTDAEAARLLDGSGVALRAESVSALVSRTHGWAVGLRFAVMRLGDIEDPDAAVEELVGDTGNIAEYLMSEMLQTQSPEDRDLLLRTSVVDVLRPGLSEELGGRSAGRRLAMLAHANVLVEEVPGHPGWYRYHPFLRDLLRAELAFASTRLLRRMHRRAAEWYAAHGFVTEAVAQAADSAWWEDAAAHAVDGLLIAGLIVGDDSNGLLSALRDLPAKAVGPRPATVRAAVALEAGEHDRCEQELVKAHDALRRLVGPVSPAIRFAVDLVEMARACAVDDPRARDSALEMANRLAAKRHQDAAGYGLTDAFVQTSLGVAQLRAGDVASSGDTLVAAVAAAEAADCTPLRITALAHLALVASLEGRLQRARDLASRSAALAADSDLARSAYSSATDIALGWVDSERYELEAGLEHVDAALRAHPDDPISRGLSSVVRARLLRGLGDLERAETLASEVGSGLPEEAAWVADLLGLEAAESLIEQGDPDRADDILVGLHRPGTRAAVVAGRAQLQRSDWTSLDDSLQELAARLGAHADLGDRVGAFVLETANELHRRQERLARQALRRALELAAPERLRRPFREAPPAVRELLAGDRRLLQQHAWLGLAPTRPSGEGSGSPAGQALRPAPVVDGQVIEPLTAKEHEVLGHLAALLSTDEIASAMFVSVNTVRTHIRSILRKLAVSRRNEAVRRARALSLIGD